jgi:hypothetical protein
MMCPLGTCCDADVHDALGNMRKLDGDIPVHEKLGMSVNFSPLQKCIGTGPSPLPLNWGTSFRTFLHYLNYASLFSILTI